MTSGKTARCAAGSKPRLADAQQAVRWAESRNDFFPKTNYAHLLEYTCRISSRPQQANAECVLNAAIAWGAKPAWWPCLSRLLLMDEPALADIIGKPHYVHDLDSPSGTALIRVWFRRVTGRSPSARTWRHAHKQVSI